LALKNIYLHLHFSHYNDAPKEIKHLPPGAGMYFILFLCDPRSKENFQSEYFYFVAGRCAAAFVPEPAGCGALVEAAPSRLHRQTQKISPQMCGK
jgi:hypothetical protein